jgi:hypothetical protein
MDFFTLRFEQLVGNFSFIEIELKKYCINKQI